MRGRRGLLRDLLMQRFMQRPDDTRMRAMNSRVSTPRDQRVPGLDAGALVPGLGNVHFADNYADAMRMAARSSAQFHSGNLRDMMNHPAVSWSRQQAGIGNGVADSMKSDIKAQLAAKGISQDDTGTYHITGLQTPGRRSGSLLSPLASNQVPGTTKPTPANVAKTQIPASVPQPGLGGTPPVPQTTLAKPSTTGSLADTIRNAMGVGKSQLPSGSTLADTIRATIQAGLPNQTARVPAPQQTVPTPNVTPPQITPPNVPQVQTPAVTTPAPTVPGRIPTSPNTSPATNLPVINAPTPLQPTPGNPQTGGMPIDPKTGLPIIQGPQALPPTAPTTTSAPGTTTPAGKVVPLSTGQGTLGSPGGDYAMVDSHNAEIEAAATEFGVPADVLKGMMQIESGGVDQTGQCRADGSCGNMQVKPDIWQNLVPGCDYDSIVSNANNCNTRTAAAIMQQAAADPQCGGNYDCAITSVYFPTDDVMNGTTQGQYIEALHQHMAAINGAAAPPQIDTTQTAPPAGTVQLPGTSSTGNPDPAPQTSSQLPPGAGLPPGMSIAVAPDTGEQVIVNQPAKAIAPPPGDITTGQAIVDLAMQGEGIAYGGVPDPSTPLDQITSWDCSGFTRWVLHNLGYTNIPMGSEGQYQVAVDQGILQTDFTGIQPGDLVFYDTGWRGGGLCQNGVCPNRASHVAIYIGNGQIIQAGTDGTTVESIQFGTYPILGFAHPGDYAPQNVYY